MTGPLDRLLASVRADPVTPAVPGDPSFSVVVRTTGVRPVSLAEAMASLAAQSRAPAEVLVMVHSPGDTSDRGKAEAVTTSLRESGGPLPDHWRVEIVEGGGRARPLNAALDTATGDYVAFLDDDDLARQSWIESFARGARQSRGEIVRAVTLCQDWTTNGGTEPVRPVGEPERPFAAEFDLLSHLSHNETPICSVALPRSALDRFGLRFDEDLAVFEDWDLLVRAAMVIGVHSIPDETSIYRRLDAGNAFAAADEATWHSTHSRVVEKLAEIPILLPPGSAPRLAAAHFSPGAGTEPERRLAEIESSPWWRLTAGPRRLVTALRSRRDRVRSR